MEMRLEEIRSLQAATDRLESLIETYHGEIESAHSEQAPMAYAYRTQALSQGEFEAGVAACSKRAELAQAQIDKTESDIRARRKEITDLTAALADVDLAFL